MKSLTGNNKKYNLYIVMTVLVIPLVLACLFTFISCALSVNYLYIDRWADGLITVFYELPFYIVEFSLYFGLGTACVAVLYKKTGTAVLSSLLCLFSGAVVTMLMFSVRFLMFFPNTSEDVIWTYFQYDFTNAMTVAVKALIGLLCIFAALLFLKLSSASPEYKRPVFVPKSVFQITALVFFGASILGSVWTFIATGLYETENFLSFGLTVLIFVAGYFAMTLSEYISIRALSSPKNKL